MIMGSITNVPTSIRTGGVRRMIITAGGNIGIGTNSPSTKLEIAGASALIAATNITTAGSSYIRFQNTTDVTTAYFGLDGNGLVGADNGSTLVGSSANKHIIIAPALTERVRITSAGNVGIGTSSPIGLLEVRGLNRCIFNDGTLQVNSSNSTGIDLGGSLSFGGAYQSTTVTEWAQISGRKETATSGEYGGYLDFATRPHLGLNCSRIRITSIGNVGINTTTPGSYKLNVNGAFYAAGSSCEYKTQICQYNTDSCMFMKLNPVTYQYKDEYTHLGKELKSGTQIGLIAEDVAQVYPELAILKEEEDDKVVRNVDYEKLSIILLSELQKLRAEVDELKSK
jgi:hypothetical protein